MKTFYRITALLLLCGISLAQSNCTRKDDIATQNFNGFSKIIPNALVTVCGSTATGQPCTPVATIYSDNACSVVVGSVSADINGNFHFYADPTNKYKYQISGSGVSTFEIGDVTLPLQSSSGVTLTKAISASSYNNVVQCDTQLGADFGIKLNNCFTALPSAGGVMQAWGAQGSQTTTTNVTLGNNTQSATLLPPNGARWSGAAQLTIAGHATGVDCGTANERMDFDLNSSPHWAYTGTTNPFVTVNAGERGVFFRNCYFQGANSAGTADGFFGSGTTAGSLSITSSDLSGTTWDKFPRDGIHLVGSFYGFNWTRCAATRNLRYGFYASSTSSADILGQAWLDSCSFTGNKVQEHIEVPDSGTVEFYQRGGTVADTLAGTTVANGIEIVPQNTCVGGTSCSALAHFSMMHIENVCGSGDGGTPDLTNGPLLWNIRLGILTVDRMRFSAGNCAHLHNAIALGSNAASPTVVLMPGNNWGTYPTTIDFSSPTMTASGIVQIFDNGVTPSNISAGANGSHTLWLNGHYFKEDGTNFSVMDSGDAVKATISNAAGLATFNGGVTTPLQLASTVVTGTAPLVIASTTPVANLTLSQHPQVEYCGATSGGTQACAKTVLTTPFIVQGEVTLNTATTQSITTLPFTNANYSCFGSDLTTATGIVSFNTYANASVTIQESGGVNTDHLRYTCVGN